MPTQIDLLLNPVLRAVIFLFAILMVWEALSPVKEAPKLKGWNFRGILAFFAYFFISSYFPVFFKPFIGPYQMVEGARFDCIVGAITGIFLYELGMYAWQITTQKSKFLKRSFYSKPDNTPSADTTESDLIQPAGYDSFETAQYCMMFPHLRAFANCNYHLSVCEHFPFNSASDEYSTPQISGMGNFKLCNPHLLTSSEIPQG